MKYSSLPGLGDFAVTAPGNCAFVALPRNRRIERMLQDPWVGEMHLFLKRKLRKRGAVDQIHTTDPRSVSIFRITPSQLEGRSGKKHKSRNRALQHDIWKAIKAFVKGRRRGLHSYAASRHHHKERLPVRRAVPAMIPARRMAGRGARG